MKAYLVGQRNPDRKTQAVTSVLVDRLTGLLSLLTIGCMAGLWNLDVILRHTTLEAFYWTAVGLTAGGLVGVVLSLSLGSHVHPRVVRLGGRFPRLAILKDLTEAVAAFHGQSRTLIAALALSVAGQLVTCLSFFLANRATGQPGPPLQVFFFVVPFGLTAMALPVAPAGIGVGQVAFYSLFQMLYHGQGDLGSAVVTIYQCVYIAASLAGAVFYIAYKPSKLSPWRRIKD